MLVGKHKKKLTSQSGARFQVLSDEKGVGHLNLTSEQQAINYMTG